MKIAKIFEQQAIMQGKKRNLRSKQFQEFQNIFTGNGLLKDHWRVSFKLVLFHTLALGLNFSPAEISDLCDGSIVQPQPTVSTHTQASSNWTMPMPQLNVDVSDDVLDFTDQLDHRNITNRNQNSQHPNTNLVDKDFQLPKGWALKENQVFGGKGSGKRMTKKVKSLLEHFFLNGNINPRDKLTAQGMRDELLKYVESEEIEEQDVPKVSTIQGWISRYAAALKHQATEAALSK
ncbi:unnamed protein product [Rhizophagus irregularis]|nr:unnamed protein product [Rhizophagus irregularis]